MFIIFIIVWKSPESVIFFVAFYIYQFKDNHHFLQEKLMIFQILIDDFVNLRQVLSQATNIFVCSFCKQITWMTRWTCFQATLIISVVKWYKLEMKSVCECYIKPCHHVLSIIELNAYCDKIVFWIKLSFTALFCLLTKIQMFIRLFCYK